MRMLEPVSPRWNSSLKCLGVHSVGAMLKNHRSEKDSTMTIRCGSSATRISPAMNNQIKADCRADAWTSPPALGPRAIIS